MVRLAEAPERFPIAAILPSRMPMSPEYHGEPVPSIMCPLLRMMSKVCDCWAATKQARTLTKAKIIHFCDRLIVFSKHRERNPIGCPAQAPLGRGCLAAAPQLSAIAGSGLIVPAR